MDKPLRFRIALSLPYDTYKFLSDKSKEDNTTFSEVIRRALDVYKASTKEVLK